MRKQRAIEVAIDARLASTESASRAVRRYDRRVIAEDRSSEYRQRQPAFIPTHIRASAIAGCPAADSDHRPRTDLHCDTLAYPRYAGASTPALAMRPVGVVSSTILEDNEAAIKQDEADLIAAVAAVRTHLVG
jgi:hypothetical protein